MYNEIERTFGIVRGTRPLLVSVPHSGIMIPEQVAITMTEDAQGSIDSDWFMKELYEPIVQDLGASLIYPVYSRYLIDLNRPEHDQSLYPGQTTTGLCPTQRFDGLSLYKSGHLPTSQEKERRLKLYWHPYHHALNSELNRLHHMHGQVLLWEGHSIRSEVPRLFDGRLPDLNLGTNLGQSCHGLIEERIREFLPSVKEIYTSVVNGRFRGGHITRYYGKPDRGIHAVQLELSQITYLANEENPEWNLLYAQKVIKVIKQLIEICIHTLDEVG